MLDDFEKAKVGWLGRIIVLPLLGEWEENPEHALTKQGSS